MVIIICGSYLTLNVTLTSIAGTPTTKTAAVWFHSTKHIQLHRIYEYCCFCIILLKFLIFSQISRITMIILYSKSKIFFMN